VTALGRGFGHPGIGFPMALLLAATVGFAASMTSATGEELGWRGVLVPELSKFSSFTTTALLTGLIWAVYHYPAIFFTNYHAQGSRIVSFAAFTVLCFAACVILTWLRLRSGSVWPAAIFHASHNLFVQDVFDQLTISKSRTEYVTTEFGVGLAIVYSLVALWLWRRRHEVAASAAPVELDVEAPAAAV
jgi:membrane protease YdiL (CAAX protease family)